MLHNTDTSLMQDVFSLLFGEIKEGKSDNDIMLDLLYPNDHDDDFIISIISEELN